MNKPRNFLPDSRATDSVVAHLRSLPDLSHNPERTAGSLPEGKEFPTYSGQIVRIVGAFAAGGMGEIYLARYGTSNAEVIVKVPNRIATAAGQGARFRHREQRLPQKLRHPNLVRKLDQGEVDGLPFVVLEHVRGHDLETLVGRCGPLPWRAACEVIVQLVDGLAAAHDQNLIHRDIKPANLVLTEDGTLKILDWGLVQYADDFGGERLTEFGQMLGSPEFAAPEQLADATKADKRSDLYSVGCTFFFLLTGKAPFEDVAKGSVPGHLIAHARAPRPTLRATNTKRVLRSATG